MERCCWEPRRLELLQGAVVQQVRIVSLQAGASLLVVCWLPWELRRLHMLQGPVVQQVRSAVLCCGAGAARAGCAPGWRCSG